MVGWLTRFELSEQLGGASTGTLWVVMLISYNPMGDFCTKHQKRLSGETPNSVLEHQFYFFLLWLLASALHHY